MAGKEVKQQHPIKDYVLISAFLVRLNNWNFIFHNVHYFSMDLFCSRRNRYVGVQLHAWQ